MDKVVKQKAPKLMPSLTSPDSSSAWDPGETLISTCEKSTIRLMNTEYQKYIFIPKFYSKYAEMPMGTKSWNKFAGLNLFRHIIGWKALVCCKNPTMTWKKISQVHPYWSNSLVAVIFASKFMWKINCIWTMKWMEKLFSNLDRELSGRTNLNKSFHKPEIEYQ